MVIEDITSSMYCECSDRGYCSQKLQLLLSGLLEEISEQHGGQVTLSERRDDHHDVLAAVLWSTAEEQCRLHCSPRGDSA